MSAVHVSPRQPLLAVNFGHLSAYEKLSFASQSGDLPTAGEGQSVFVHFHHQNRIADKQRRSVLRGSASVARPKPLVNKANECSSRKTRPLSPLVVRNSSPRASDPRTTKRMSSALSEISERLSEAIDSSSLKNLRVFSDGESRKDNNSVSKPSQNTTKGLPGVAAAASSIPIFVPSSPTQTSNRTSPHTKLGKKEEASLTRNNASQGISSSSLSSKMPLKRASLRQPNHGGCWVRWCCQPYAVQDEKETRGVPPLELKPKAPHRVSIPDGTALQLDKLLPREWVEGVYDTHPHVQVESPTGHVVPRKAPSSFERAGKTMGDEMTAKISHAFGAMEAESYSTTSSSSAFGSAQKGVESEQDTQQSLQNYLSKITTTPSLRGDVPRRHLEPPHTIPQIAPWARRAAAESAIQKASLVHLKLKSEAKRKLGSANSGSNLSQRSQQGSRINSLERLGDSETSAHLDKVEGRAMMLSHEMSGRSGSEAPRSSDLDQRSMLTPPSWSVRDKDPHSRSLSTSVLSDALSYSHSPLPNVPLKSMEPIPRCRSIRLKNAANPSRNRSESNSRRLTSSSGTDSRTVSPIRHFMRAITTNISLEEPDMYDCTSESRQRSDAPSGSIMAYPEPNVNCAVSTNATTTIRSSLTDHEGGALSDRRMKPVERRVHEPRTDFDAGATPVPILRGNRSPARRRDSGLPKLTFCLPKSSIDYNDLSNDSLLETSSLHETAATDTMCEEKDRKEPIALPLSFFASASPQSQFRHDDTLNSFSRKSTTSLRASQSQMSETRSPSGEKSVRKSEQKEQLQKEQPQKEQLQKEESQKEQLQKDVKKGENPSIKTTEEVLTQRTSGATSGRKSRPKHKHRDPNWLPDRNYRRNSAEEFMFEYSSLSSLSGLTSSSSSLPDASAFRSKLGSDTEGDSAASSIGDLIDHTTPSSRAGTLRQTSFKTGESGSSPMNWVPEPSRFRQSSCAAASTGSDHFATRDRAYTASTDGFRSIAQSTYHASDLGSSLSAFMRGPHPRLKKTNSARTRAAQIRFDKSVPCAALVLKPDGKMHLQHDFALRLTTTHVLLTKGKQSKAYDLKDLYQVDSSRRPLQRARKQTAAEDKYIWQDTDADIDSLESNRTICTLRFAGRKIPVIIVFESSDDLNDFVELLGLHTQGYTTNAGTRRKVIFYYPKS